MAKAVKAKPDCVDAFRTSLSPHPLPRGPPGQRGPELLGATGRGFRAQPRPPPPSDTTSFPSEEAAAATAKAAAAPALRVYIFFTKSSGIVNLFFKTQRGEEPCIICKHCIIGYVVQSLLYSGLSGSCHKTVYMGSLPPASQTQALCPASSIPPPQTVTTARPLPYFLPAAVHVPSSP